MNNPHQQFLLDVANDFRLFVKYALTYLGFTPAHIQLEMAEFMQSGEERLAILAARGYSKTYLICLYICWRFMRNPHLKIKVMSNSHVRAKEITGQCLTFLRKLPWLQFLAPQGKTGETKFNIHNSYKEKEPSLNAISVYSTNTGGRIDLAILDDVESEQIDTHEKRQTVLNSCKEISAMLHPQTSRPFYAKFAGDLPLPERTVVVCLGTYSTVESIYIVPEDGSPHFLRGAKIKRWPALNENSESTFPERFSTAYLLEQKNKHFDYVYWQLQFMLCPEKVIGSDCPFKFDKIEKFAVEHDISGCSNVGAFIDTAAGHDYSTCVIGGMKDRKLYIFDIIYYNNETTEESLIKICNYLLKVPNLNRVWVEGNLATPAQIFKKLAREKNLRARVEEFRVSGNKHQRVLKQVEPALHSGDVYVHRKLLNPEHQLRKEMNAWTYKKEPPEHIHDDCTDSLSTLILLYNNELGRGDSRVYQGTVV